jgi:hypothetical protein
MVYEAHELAAIVPMANKYEQEALRLDIEKHGQTDPISLYRNKIIDGRCRQKACNDLGIEPTIENLQHNLTLEELSAFAFSKNTRRNLNTTQKAIKAYKQMVSTKQSATVISKLCAVTRANLNHVEYISKHRQELIDPLFNGEKINFINKKTGRTDSSNSLYPIRKSIEVEIKQTTEGEVPSVGRVDVAKGFKIIESAFSIIPDSISFSVLRHMTEKVISAMETNHMEGHSNDK